MRRSSILAGFIGGIIFANIGAHAPAQDRRPVPDDLTTITGCLTGGPEGATYYVTAKPRRLASKMAVRTEGAVRTYSYHLVPPRDIDLQDFLGHTVEVRGRIDPEVDEELSVEREEEAAVDPPPDERRPTPKVEVEQEAQVEIRELEVVEIRSVAPNCAEPPQ